MSISYGLASCSNNSLPCVCVPLLGGLLWRRREWVTCFDASAFLALTNGTLHKTTGDT